jgi:hypothetical protein
MRKAEPLERRNPPPEKEVGLIDHAPPASVGDTVIERAA